MESSIYVSRGKTGERGTEKRDYQYLEQGLGCWLRDTSGI